MPLINLAILPSKPSIIAAKIPLFISYGENEPEGWKHQSISYCEFLTKHDYVYKVLPSKGDNHFSLIDTIANEDSNICKEIIHLSK